MDLRPVCTGWLTDWRSMTPGATFSIGDVSAALIGPLPSIGLPKESTTRPRSSSPTGTSRILLVVLTVSPSEMCLYSPNTTAPTESCSRFSARPKLPPGNSIISPYCTSASPWMRTIPSDTAMTVPTSRASALASKLSIRCLISSLISEALSAIYIFLLRKSLTL